jgi:hypothetical protein
MNILIEKIKGYLPYIAGLLVIACIIFYPELQGKKLNTHDNVSVIAASKEFNDYYKKGESIKWTNRLFSGMPLYTLTGDYSGNYVFNVLSRFTFNASLSNTKILFIVFLNCFLGLLLLGVNRKISFILSIAIGLNSWLLDSLWASHPTKILSYSMLPLAISGYISFMKTRQIKALLAIMIGLSFSVASSHYQIVYYGIIIFAILALYFLYRAVIDKDVFNYIKSSALVLLIVSIAGISNLSSLMVVQDYNKDTMRGGKTELVKEDANSTSKGGGLNIEYAMNWSYGTAELFNFFIPDASGGASQYKVKTKDSKLAQAINPNETEATLPMYWGAQPFTGAPNYLGAGIFFLFVFAMFQWRSKLKFLFLGLVLLSVMMGLGKNFLGFNELLFQYLPLYNKFRTPTMSFSILNIIVILTIGLGVSYFLTNINDENRDEIFRKLKYAFYTSTTFLVLGLLIVPNQDYLSISDTQTFRDNKQALDLILEDRASLFKSDFLRSLFIILILAGSLWGFIKKKLALNTLMIIIGVVTFLDLFTVHKRYFSPSIFEKVENTENLIADEAYNRILEQDKSHFRVFNTADPSVFNDNTIGYRFSNVGGYSPAKLYRYQDLIDVHLSKGNINVLNMLNTKYFIVDNQGQKTVQENPNACGNAWFVKAVKFAENANAEMDSIGVSDLKQTAWVDKRYQKETNFDSNSDPLATIVLSNYHPENMTYTSNSKSGGFAVFSEIWYRGNEDWKLYIDGKLQRLIRTNYLLRGAYIPSGNHKIEMKFTADKLDTNILISRIATSIMVLLIIGYIFRNYTKRTT